jgi:hypothetical protein
VAACKQLRAAWLSGNALSSLRGLEACGSLLLLDVSRNRLLSLAGLGLGSAPLLQARAPALPQGPSRCAAHLLAAHACPAVVSGPGCFCLRPLGKAAAPGLPQGRAPPFALRLWCSAASLVCAVTLALAW